MLVENLNLRIQSTSKKNKVRIIMKEPPSWEASFFDVARESFPCFLSASREGFGLRKSRAT